MAFLGRWGGLLGLAGLVIAAAGCGTESTFACTEDSSCSNGWCEPNGYCSFPAEDCASGRRFGGLSGPFSDQCVAPGPGEDTEGGGTLGTASTGSGTSTSQPTLDTGVESTSTTSGASSSGELGCELSEVCLPPPPDSWEGPVTLAAIERGCETSTAFEGSEAFEGRWSCTCDCAVETPMSCGGSNTRLQLFDTPGCEGDPVAEESIDGACSELMVPGAYFVSPTNEQPAACEVDTNLVATPITAIGGQAGCEIDAGAACAGGTCYGAEQIACIYAAGDLECPAGEFSERTLLYGGSEDERACSPCTCEGTSSCGGSVRVYPEQASCTGMSLSVSIGACSDGPTGVRSAEVVALQLEPMAECETFGGQPNGGITPTAPITVCCRG